MSVYFGIFQFSFCHWFTYSDLFHIIALFFTHIKCINFSIKMCCTAYILPSFSWWVPFISLVLVVAMLLRWISLQQLRQEAVSLRVCPPVGGSPHTRTSCSDPNSLPLPQAGTALKGQPNSRTPRRARESCAATAPQFDFFFCPALLLSLKSCSGDLCTQMSCNVTYDNGIWIDPRKQSLQWDVWRITYQSHDNKNFLSGNRWNIVTAGRLGVLEVLKWSMCRTGNR